MRYAASGTNLHEIAPGIYRINTPAELPGGAFSFNQYLVADEAPLLFHTGPRAMFPLVAEAAGKVLPLESLRYIGFAHVEADELGSLNQFLAAAPRAVAVARPGTPPAALFTQGGSGATPITESDILRPSEAFRAPMDYYAHAPHTASVPEKLAREQPQVLACMHGGAWR